MQQVIIKEKKKLMENILLCINMMVLSVQDIMYKSLNVIILVILTITAVIYTAFNFNFSLPEIIAGICFVGALFGVSITLKEQFLQYFLLRWQHCCWALLIL